MICRNLPPPLRPDIHSSDEDHNARGSLSDFSDYDSSDEGTHSKRASVSHQASDPSASTSYGTYHARKNYVNVSDDEPDARKDARKGLLEEDDPFADPFADQGEVPTPGIVAKHGMGW